MSVIVAMNAKEKEENGMVKVAIAIGYSNEGGKTPDVAWFDMEVAEEGKVFVMKVAMAEDEKGDPEEEEHVECIITERENKLWLAKEEEKRMLAGVTELTATIKFSSGLQTRPSGKSMVDGLQGIFIREYDSLALCSFAGGG
jgi:hypothetical protein